MRKFLLISFSLSIILISMTGCSKGRSAMADNDKLGEILSQSAHVSENLPPSEDAPIDNLNDQSSENEGVTYYKLKANMNIFVEAGDYTISMAKSDCTVTAFDASGNSVGSIRLSSDSESKINPHVGNLSVPEGGYLISTADCAAMKN
ncbi:MAG: hypothetical protein K5894_00315 [Lachnospiraceae bacterium]|nr:hypothetical protein [Lachnospiraceae bacterium]